jgi:cell division protein FtsB
MTTTKKSFFAILGVIGIIVGGGVGIFSLLDGQMKQLNGEVAKLKADQEAIRSQIDIYASARKKVEELRFVQDLADSVLPPSKEQANVVAELKKFITDSGLQFDSVAFTGDNSKIVGGIGNSQTEQVEGLAGVRILPTSVVIRAGATYQQVLKLLETIEQNQRKMQLTEITLVPNDESATAFSTITMTVNIYLRAVQ